MQSKIIIINAHLKEMDLLSQHIDNALFHTENLQVVADQINHAILCATFVNPNPEERNPIIPLFYFPEIKGQGDKDVRGINTTMENTDWVPQPYENDELLGEDCMVISMKDSTDDISFTFKAKHWLKDWDQAGISISGQKIKAIEYIEEWEELESNTSMEDDHSAPASEPAAEENQESDNSETDTQVSEYSATADCEDSIPDHPAGDHPAALQAPELQEPALQESAIQEQAHLAIQEQVIPEPAAPVNPTIADPPDPTDPAIPEGIFQPAIQKTAIHGPAIQEAAIQESTIQDPLTPHAI